MRYGAFAMYQEIFQSVLKANAFLTILPKIAYY